MNTPTITNAKYLKPLGYSDNFLIKATFDGRTMNVPIAPGNRFYDEIKRQVDAGTITIEAAS